MEISVILDLMYRGNEYMYYIEQEDNELVKYEVTIERKKLEKIRDEIIWKCGEVIHRSYKGAGVLRPTSEQMRYLENYTMEEAGIQENLGGPNTQLYRFEYDEHCETELSLLIKQLLCGNTKAIEKIENHTFDSKENIKAKIQQGRKELSEKIQKVLSVDISEIDTDELEKLKKEIKLQQNYMELNDNIKSDLEYYEQVMNCIHFTEIERIDKSLVEKVNAFQKVKK